MLRHRCWALIGFGLICLQVGLVFQVRAESGSNWSVVVILGEYVKEGINNTIPLSSPCIVGETQDRLHVFWALHPDNAQESAIFYTSWNGETWSSPVDVLVGPNLGTPNGDVKAVIDRRGDLHVVWRNGDLYYSRAHSDEAADPHAWLPPVQIAEGVSLFDLTLTQDDRLHLVYAYRSNLFYRQHVPDYDQWSTPTAIIQPEPFNAGVDYPSIWIAENQVIHIAWGQFSLPEGWPPMGVYYSQSQDSGESWSVPIQLGGYDQGNPVLLGKNDNEIHMVWLATGADGRYYSYSVDGGSRWVPARRFVPENVSGMLVGIPHLVIDSANQLHLYTGGGIGGRDQLYSSDWLDDQWAALEEVSVAERSGIYPDVLLTQGNILHLVWVASDTTDGMLTNSERFFVAYARRYLDAPTLMTATSTPVLATPVPVFTSTPEQESDVDKPATAMPTASTVGIIQAVPDNTVRPIGLGIGGALLVVMMAFLYRLYSKGRL